MLITVPNYAISVTALRDYRAGAKNDRNLDIEVLKAKINCLIYACDRQHVSFIVCGQRYVFGKCKFEVNREGRVVNISWIQADATPTRKEVERLKEAYEYKGLNKRGTRFIEKVA